MPQIRRPISGRNTGTEEPDMALQCFPHSRWPNDLRPQFEHGCGGGFSSSTPQYNDLTYLLSETIKETYSAMMHSQVALYPVDVEGQNAENDPGDQVTKGAYEDAIAAATGGHAYYGGNRLQLLLDQAVENGESYSPQL